MANNELSLSSLGIQLPYNMQAEQSVLGAALMDETILNRLITEMDPDMFYSEQNRAVYEEMRRLFSESDTGAAGSRKAPAGYPLHGNTPGPRRVQGGAG